MKKYILILSIIMPTICLADCDSDGKCIWDCSPDLNNQTCTATLYNNGTMHISGSGAMGDYTSTTMPWYTHLDKIKTLVVDGQIKDSQGQVISSGITSIGRAAFIHATNLNSVSMPESITSINSYAFQDTALVDIHIPSSVTEIGGHAFEDNTSLKNVVIPDSVTTIGYKTFEDCSALESIVVGNSLETIGIYAFNNINENTKIYCPNNECYNLIASSVGFPVSDVEFAIYAKEGNYYVLKDNNANTLTDSKGNPIYYATLDLMAHGAACTDKKNCDEILASNGASFKVGSKIYNSVEDFAKGNNIKFRIYTIDEANKVAGPINRVSIKYR